MDLWATLLNDEDFFLMKINSPDFCINVMNALISQVFNSLD